jgi:secondary thiamine-phosphate synthase enzyme
VAYLKTLFQLHFSGSGCGKVTGHLPERAGRNIFFTAPVVSMYGELMFRTILSVTSSREGDILNITPQVEKAVSESKVRTGLVHLFVQHSTAALTTIEFEPGVLKDLRRALSVMAPDNEDYAHNSRWGDGNGRSHVKAALVGPSITVPVENGQLMCGTWQQVVLLELDVNAGRKRTITCTVTGS